MHTEFHPLPQPEEISNKERNDATGSYMMMLISMGVGLPLPFINLLAAWFYYEVMKKKSRFVRFHALQSLLSQLPITLLNSVAVVWFVLRLIAIGGDFFGMEVLTFVLVLGAFNLLYFILSIVGAVNAHRGRMYYMPVIGAYSYRVAFRVSQDDFKVTPSNEPPA